MCKIFVLIRSNAVYAVSYLLFYTVALAYCYEPTSQQAQDLRTIYT